MALLNDLFDLFLPANCAICGRPPKVICDSCIDRFEKRQRKLSRGSLHGWALCDLDQDLSKAISAFKEHGQFSIANLLVDRLLTIEALEWLGTSSAEVLVAMPSAPSSFAKRGFLPAELVAKRLAARTGLPLARRALWLSRATADQAALGSADRAANIAGAMTASPRLMAKRVLIVDDIVTTGSSVLEAARAVESAGGQAVGFFTIAETILRNATPSRK